MSYVDMHDLHPENVQAAQMSGFVSGAMEGGTLAAMPVGGIGLIAALAADEKEGAESAIKLEKVLNGKTLGIGAAIIATSAVVMGAVRAFTAKKEAETHNAWSDKVLSRMETRENMEAQRYATALHHERENASQDTQIG